MFTLVQHSNILQKYFMPDINIFIISYCFATCYHLTGLSPETFLGHFYFPWFFLFSLHSVADQIGAAPITCQRNVPTLSSITSLTRTGITVVLCRPLSSPGAAARNPGESTEMRVCFGVHVQINMQVCTHACLRSIDAASGSIT